jgi:rhodanese-related sulfurtransferase
LSSKTTEFKEATEASALKNVNAKKVFFVLLPVFVVTCAFARVPPGISVEEALKIAKEPETSLIDVRTSQEYVEGHIEGAVNVPVAEIQSSWQGLPKDHYAPIIVYCTIGVRSSKARVILKERGYTRVYNLKGGIESWKAAGQPVVKSPLETSPYH